MIRRAALIVMSTGLALSLGGCVLATKEQVTTIPVAHVSGSAIQVTAHNGRITVKQAGDPDVRIVATLRMISDERLASTTISANRDSAGTLVILATPPGGTWRSNEGCGFDITLPEARGVTLRSNNGRIETVGLSGAADVKTSNGSIVIENQDGPVQAASSNGRIEVLSPTGSVDCSTSNGSVKVSLAPASTGPVKIDTSNGSITLKLGTGFSGTIAAKTSNGSISGPDTRSGVAFEREGRTRARLTVGSGRAASTLDTSNGSISILYAD